MWKVLNLAKKWFDYSLLCLMLHETTCPQNFLLSILYKWCFENEGWLQIETFVWRLMFQKWTNFSSISVRIWSTPCENGIVWDTLKTKVPDKSFVTKQLWAFYFQVQNNRILSSLPLWTWGCLKQRLFLKTHVV